MKQLSDDQLSILAEKWLDGTITPQEKSLFDAWYEQQPEAKIVLETKEGDENVFREKVMARIRATTGKRHATPTIKFWIARVAAAALIAAALGVGYLWWQSRPVTQNLTAKNTEVYDLAPGGNKALLTLADGRKILLDKASAGQVASLAGSHIVKLGAGQLAIQPTGAIGQNGLTGTNTLTTPNGGKYQLELPDGTQVWLNAASSIEFPTAYNGNTREVKITGEAYFEVVHDNKRPFIVRSGNTVIKDIGTHFNVMAYADEGVKKVTLQEGAVEVSQQGDSQRQLLKPGQQVQVTPAGKLRLINHVDAEGTIAWKQGRFNFQDADLEEVMRQLARWYDVEVVYKNGVPDLEFIGQVQRDLPLSEVLKGLKMSGVHFELEKGKRLLVYPK